MSRPLYENSQDRTNELQVMQSVARIAQASFKKLPIRYSVDYALMRDGEFYAWIEVKCRKNAMAKYPTLMISAAKLMEGVNLSKHTGKPFYLVVRWVDGLGRVKIDDLTKFKLSFGGRFDRGDDQDAEPVYEIPVNEFLVLQQ